MGLIRATNPAMLRPGEDGFTVDFDSLDGKSEYNPDELLLLKFRAILESPVEASSYGLDLVPAEARGLAETLEKLESLQPWPGDVSTMCRNLRTRLAAVE